MCCPMHYPGSFFVFFVLFGFINSVCFNPFPERCITYDVRTFPVNIFHRIHMSYVINATSDNLPR